MSLTASLEPLLHLTYTRTGSGNISYGVQIHDYLEMFNFLNIHIILSLAILRLINMTGFFLQSPFWLHYDYIDAESGIQNLLSTTTR